MMDMIRTGEIRVVSRTNTETGETVVYVGLDSGDRDSFDIEGETMRLEYVMRQNGTWQTWERWQHNDKLVSDGWEGIPTSDCTIDRHEYRHLTGNLFDIYADDYLDWHELNAERMQREAEDLLYDANLYLGNLAKIREQNS